MKLILDAVTKTIRGRLILDHVCLELDGGNIYGLVGKNASGKTMLFRAISGLMKIDSGKISADGKELKKDFEVLPSLGLILENAGLYNGLTGFENLKKLASYKKCISDDEICNALVRVGLNPVDKRKYYKYSLGMRQHLAIAQAVMEHPDVILLDEPTNGLDDDGIELIRELILEEKERGALIMLASHSKEDIDLLSDFVYTIKEGRIVA